MKKRGVKPIYTQGKKTIACSGGAMPDPTDIKILAETIALCESCMAGIARIGLLTCDSDFREFGSEIERMFRIRIY